MNEPLSENTESRANPALAPGAIEPLSEAGRLRRDALLVCLQEMVRGEPRRRARRLLLRSTVAASLIVVVGIGWALRGPDPRTRLAVRETEPTESVDGSATREAPEATDGAMPVTPDVSQPPWSILTTRPGALARHEVVVPVDPSRYQIDDRKLLETLAAIGRPTGLVRSGGKVWLTRAVTDRELAPREPNAEASGTRHRAGGRSKRS